jgi:hypothetical protein
MSGKRDSSSDPKGVTFLHVPASETVGTHLAHWPPPLHGHDFTPVIMKHQPGEPIKRAKPRGWRLTRAMFSEFQEDE